MSYLSPTSWTDVDYAGNTLSWTSRTGKLLYPAYEMLRLALIERLQAVGTASPVAPLDVPLAPETLISRLWKQYFHGYISTLIPKFADHTQVDLIYSYDGQATIPMWTESSLLAAIGDASRVPWSYHHSAAWEVQQYKILNMLRYYVTRRAGTTPLNYRYADATDADLATAIANAKNNLTAASWGHSGPVAGQTGTWAAYYDNVGTYNVQLFQGRYYFEYNNTTPFDILFHLYGYVNKGSGGANYFDPIGTAPAENKWYALDYSQTIPASTDWDYGYYDNWILDNVPTPSSFPYTAAGMVDDEYSLGYKYLLKFTGANGFKFRDWVPETIPI